MKKNSIMNWLPTSTPATATLNPTASSSGSNLSSSPATASKGINLNNSDFITPKSQPSPYGIMNNPLNYALDIDDNDDSDENVSHLSTGRSVLCQQNDAEQPLLANDIVKLLKRSRIKLVAFDFDQTIISIHTGGFWRDSAEKLAEFVRPCFKYLMPELLKCENIFVAVVTFSPQEELIREVLRLSMNTCGNLTNRIIIRGNTKEFVDKYGVEHCFYNGKQIHINYCKDYIEMRSNEFKILNEDVFLIDDDIDNIGFARKNGHLAYHINKTVNLNDINLFLKSNISV